MSKKLEVKTELNEIPPQPQRRHPNWPQEVSTTAGEDLMVQS